VLLVGDEMDEINIPKRLLPPDAVEGSSLTLRFETNQESAAQRKRRIARLIEELGSQSVE